MPERQIRPSLDPQTCAVCGRRLLQGEQVNWYVAPDSSRRVVCELDVGRAERARWTREREGEEIVQLRPTRAKNSSFMQRALDFFASPDEDDLDQFNEPAYHEPGDQGSRRSARSSRRRERLEKPQIAAERREVLAVPTGSGSKLEQGLYLFNTSQFPRTIAGLSRSLGEPQVAALNHSDTSVEVFVGWDIAWYSYRVDLGDATEPVEQSGRGNDSAELASTVDDWNAYSDEYGRLFLTDSPFREPRDESGAGESDATPDGGGQA